MVPSLEVLGLGVGPPRQRAATYSRFVRAYQPDQMAGELQEVRELAEQRMKEINVAYPELKQRDGATGRERGRGKCAPTFYAPE